MRITKSVKSIISAARVGKTKEVIVLQGNYGYGWDDLVTYESNEYSEAKKDLKAYRENEKGASHRLINRRVPNPDWKAPTDRYSVLQYDFGFTRKIGDTAKFSDMEEAITYATDLWNQQGIEVLLKDRVSGFSVQLIPGDEYRTNRNLDNFREVAGADRSTNVASATHTSVVASDISDTFMNGKGYVFYYNGKELYRGDNSDNGLVNAVEQLCNDESVNSKFQEWCNQFGDPFEFDGTPKDTAVVFSWLVDQEYMEDGRDFHQEGSGILNFEIFATPDSQAVESFNKTTACTDTTVKSATDISDEASVDDEDWVYTESGERNLFLNPGDFVFIFNGKELYRGSGDGFYDVILDLCLDESIHKKFQDWCYEDGISFELDGSPGDTAQVFAEIVFWENSDNIDLYLDGRGILDFEIFNVPDIVQSSDCTNTAVESATDINSTDIDGYCKKLADGVVKMYEDYWGDTTDIKYTLTKEAITFEDGSAVYIQPIEDITPNMDELESDTEELYLSVVGDFMPF